MIHFLIRMLFDGLNGIAVWGLFAATRGLVRRIQARNLRSPKLNGVFLPAVDDPRWRTDNTNKSATLVTSARGQAGGEFFVYINGYSRCDGLVKISVDGNWEDIGKHKPYVRAIARHLQARDQARLVDTSIKYLAETP